MKMLKLRKLTAFTLALIMILAVIPEIKPEGLTAQAASDAIDKNPAYNGFIAPPNQSSVPSDAIYISTPEELLRIGLNNSGSNQYFVLRNDIDMAGVQSPSAGYYIYDFLGTLDGNGYSIKNMSNCLIYRLGYRGNTLRNVAIKNLGLHVRKEGMTAGAVLANMVWCADIENCYSTGGRLNGASGGLIGRIYSISYNPAAGMGGLAIAYIDWTNIINCYSECDIVSTGSYVGGLIGYWDIMNSLAYETNDIIGCYATGNITNGDSTYTGGLFGYLNTRNAREVMISDCHAKGKVTGAAGYTGGFAGYLNLPDSKAIISGCTYSSLNATGAPNNNYSGLIPFNYSDPEDASVSIRVLDEDTGSPINGAQVWIDGAKCLTNAAGWARFNKIEPAYISQLRITADYYFTHSQQLAVFDGNEYTFYLKKSNSEIYISDVSVVLPDDGLRSVINSSVLVHTSETGYYRVTANVDWNGNQMDYIQLKGSGGNTQIITGGVPVRLGSTFSPGETLSVVAVAKNGVRAEVPVNIEITDYDLNVELYLPSAETSTIPDGFPFLEGSKFCFEAAKNLADLAVTKIKDGKIILELNGAIDCKMIGNNAVEAKLSGRVEIPIEQLADGKWEGYVNFNVVGKKPIFQASKTFTPGGIPVLVKCELKGGLTSQLRMKGSRPGYYEGHISPSLTLDAFGGLGAAAGDYAEISAGLYVETGAYLGMELNPATMTAKAEIAIGLRATCKLFNIIEIVEGWEIAKGEWQYPEKRNMAVSAAANDSGFDLSKGDLEFVGRDYLKDTPSDFTGGTSKACLYENAHPATQSGIQVINGVPTMVYTMDDTEREVQDALKLVYSTHDGTRWSEPEAVYDNGTMDSAFSFDGGFVAYENTKTKLGSNISSIKDMMKESEISVSYFNGTDWSEPVTFTNNDYADFAPVVAAYEDKAAVAWLSNDESDVIGNTGVTNIHCVTFDGNEWSEITTVPNVGNVKGLELVFNGTNGRIVFNREGSLYMTNIGQADFKPIQLCYPNSTLTAVTNAASYTAAYTNGKYLLAYFDTNGNLVVVNDWKDSWDTASTVLLNSETKSKPMIVSNGTDCYILWIGREEGNDALCAAKRLGDEYYSYWGTETITLLNSDFNLKTANAALTEAGNLLFTYLQEDTIEVEYEEEVPVFTGGKCDLYLTEIIPSANIVIAEDSFEYNDEFYGLTGIVKGSVSVTNAGSLAIDSTTLQIYEDGVLKQSNAYQGSLLSGEQRTINFSYQPKNPNKREIEIKIVPDDESLLLTGNNSALLGFGKVNASVEEAYFTCENGSYYLNTTVSNKGSLTASSFKVQIYSDNENEQPVTEKTLTNVSPGEVINIREVIADLNLSEGDIARYIVTVTAPGDEPDQNNSMLAVASYIESASFPEPPQGKINQPALTVNAVTGKKYGDAPFKLSTTGGSGTGLVNYTVVSGPGRVSGDTLTITGAGNIIITANKAGDIDFHAATSAQRTITVAKKTITVTADNKSKKYGKNDPTLTYRVSGLVGSDKITTGSLRYTGKDIGKYNIVEKVKFSHPNYNITFKNGTMTIQALGKTPQLTNKNIPKNQTVKRNRTVTLKAPKNTVLYYTTNGKKATTKTKTKTKAGGSVKIKITNKTTVRVIAVRTGHTPSREIRRVYKVK